MYVCICKGITDKTIRNAVLDGANSLRDIRNQLGVAMDCGQCACEAKKVIRETLQEMTTAEQGLFYAA